MASDNKQTTGHVWDDDLQELTNPLPNWWLWTFYLTIIFSVIYWLMYPAWPIGHDFTKGMKGLNTIKYTATTVDGKQVEKEVHWNMRAKLMAETNEAEKLQKQWFDKVASTPFEEVAKNAELMQFVQSAGKTLFGDNCAACHGRNAQGGKGFPNLTTNSWLWGGTPEAIFQTITVGINSAHPETRTSQMPAFGKDGMLPRADIEKVIAFVRSLSQPNAKDIDPAKVAAGKDLFAANCASCHGEDAKGNTEMGAPNLTDQFWIYGGNQASVAETLWGGRQGHMPTWEARLSALDRKILALYLVDLRKPDK